jgi:hypothetical protein
VNRKAVQHLWREEGLRVPIQRRKRQRLGASTTAADRLTAEHPDHVWALGLPVRLDDRRGFSSCSTWSTSTPAKRSPLPSTGESTPMPPWPSWTA